MCKTNSNFEKFQNAANLIYTVRNVGNDDSNYFALVSMMRTTGVQIS